MESSRPLAGQEVAPESAATPRINVRRLTVALALCLVLPVGFALLADLALGTWPWLTMGVSLLCIPVATVVVGGMALQEMNRIVRLAAPETPGEEAPATGLDNELAVASSHHFEAG